MAVLTVQNVTPQGIAPTYAAAAGGGDSFVAADSGVYLLHVKNGGGSAITVTVNDPTTADPGGATAFNPDLAVSVPNAGERMIELDPGRFETVATGSIDITYSGVTTVTVGVFLIKR